jgi:hypothetical protein
MPKFNVYQQLAPINTGKKDKDGTFIHRASLRQRGTVDAASADAAIALAKHGTHFRVARANKELGGYPIVQEVKHERATTK